MSKQVRDLITLSEMGGFDPPRGIVVLAATNRSEAGDAALPSPGRFGRWEGSNALQPDGDSK